MSNHDVSYQEVGGDCDPPASLLNIKIRRRRSGSPEELSELAFAEIAAQQEPTKAEAAEGPDNVVAFESSQQEFPPPSEEASEGTSEETSGETEDRELGEVEYDEFAVPEEPAAMEPETPDDPLPAPEEHAEVEISPLATGVEELIDLWAAHLSGRDSLPREIPIETIIEDWPDVFVLSISGWRGRRVQVEERGRASVGDMDLGASEGPIAELLDLARRSISHARPYHESMVFTSERGEAEVGLLTLPVASDGKHPDRVLCHYYRV